MLEKLTKEIASTLEDKTVLSSNGVAALPDKKISIAEYITSQNRAYRRKFKKQNGIFLPGTTQSFVRDVK